MWSPSNTSKTTNSIWDKTRWRWNYAFILFWINFKSFFSSQTVFESLRMTSKWFKRNLTSSFTAILIFLMLILLSSSCDLNFTRYSSDYAPLKKHPSITKHQHALHAFTQHIIYNIISVLWKVNDPLGQLITNKTSTTYKIITIIKRNKDWQTLNWMPFSFPY